MIQKIPVSRWKELERIFRAEFDSDLPDPKFAEIIGEYDDLGRIKSFVVKEKIVMVGLIYVRPSERSKNNGQAAKKLVSYLVNSLPDGLSVGAVASETRFESLFRLFRMQKIAGAFFRRNL